MTAFQELPPDEMDEALDSAPCGHACLYFLDHEIHVDLHGDIEDFGNFAKGVGEFITMIMLRQVQEPDQCRH